MAEPDNDQTPRAVTAAGGLVLSAVTPSQGAAGLNTSTLVRLRDSLSNPSRPLLALVKGLEEVSAGVNLQIETVETDPAVATSARENRMLSPDEVIELVEMYGRGATERSLAQRFGAHRHTIGRHLQRAGVVKRPKTTMTEREVARARELYEGGWSTPRIERELGLNASTVGKALKRAGVRMRPPVA